MAASKGVRSGWVGLDHALKYQTRLGVAVSRLAAKSQTYELQKSMM